MKRKTTKKKYSGVYKFVFVGNTECVVEQRNELLLKTRR